MNKKGEHGFYLIIAILSLSVVSYGYWNLMVIPRLDKSYELGKGLGDLIESEREFIVLENYLNYNFKYTVLSSLNKIISENKVIEKNDNLDEELKKEVKLEFEKRIKETKELFDDNLEIIIPEDFEIEILYEKGGFIIELNFREDIIVKNSNSLEVKLYKKLSFKHEIDFDLNIFDKYYEEYSSINDEKCNNLKGNELFNEKNLICKVDNGYYSFEVEQSNLKLINNIIKFRISRTGNLKFV